MDLQEESTKQQIGSIIKSIRKSKKLTQKQLAIIMTGKVADHGLISRIENGERDNVRFDTIYMVLLALEIDLLEILTNLKTK